LVDDKKLIFLYKAMNVLCAMSIDGRKAETNDKDVCVEVIDSNDNTAESVRGIGLSTKFPRFG